MSEKSRAENSIHTLIAERWSPYGYSDRQVSSSDLAALFEAASWAASSFNEQPWRYIVAVKQAPEEFAKLLSCLVEANQAWAKHAPALALGLARTNFTRNGKPNRVALHDLGAASTTLALEAVSRGLAVHQMAGIDPEKARAVYEVPEDYDIDTGLAIGYAADAETLPAELRSRDTAERTRKPLAELVFAGRFGTPALL